MIIGIKVNLSSNQLHFLFSTARSSVFGSKILYLSQNFHRKPNQTRARWRTCIYQARNWVCQIMLIKMYKLTHGCWTQVCNDKRTMLACIILHRRNTFLLSYFSHNGYFFFENVCKSIFQKLTLSIRLISFSML